MFGWVVVSMALGGSFGQQMNDTRLTTSTTATATWSETTTSSAGVIDVASTSSVFVPGNMDGVMEPDPAIIVGFFSLAICEGLRFWGSVLDKFRSPTRRACMLITESACTNLVLFGVLKQHPASAVLIVFLFRISSILHLLRICRCLSGSIEVDIEDPDKLTAVSVYTDMNNSLLNCVAIFLVQIMLYIYVVMEVWYQYPMVEEQEWKFYLGACVGTVLRLQFHEAFADEEISPFWVPFFEYHGNWYGTVRFIMSFLVNEVMANGVVSLLPALLMASSSNLEFVKDATAFVFISQLDNYATGPRPVDFKALFPDRR